MGGGGLEKVTIQDEGMEMIMWLIDKNWKRLTWDQEVSVPSQLKLVKLAGVLSPANHEGLCQGWSTEVNQVQHSNFSTAASSAYITESMWQWKDVLLSEFLEIPLVISMKY